MMASTETMATEHTNQLKILVSDEEKTWLEAVASARGLTSSDWVRQMIRDAFTALQERKQVEAAEDDFHWKEWHEYVLLTLKDQKDPVLREDIEQTIAEEQWPGPPDMGLAPGPNWLATVTCAV